MLGEGCKSKPNRMLAWAVQLLKQNCIPSWEAFAVLESHVPTDGLGASLTTILTCPLPLGAHMAKARVLPPLHWAVVAVGNAGRH